MTEFQDSRVLTQLFALVWHKGWGMTSDGLVGNVSSWRRQRKATLACGGPYRDTARYAWRHFSSSCVWHLLGSGQSGRCMASAVDSKVSQAHAGILLLHVDGAQLQQPLQEPRSPDVSLTGRFLQPTSCSASAVSSRTDFQTPRGPTSAGRVGSGLPRGIALRFRAARPTQWP